MYITSSSQNHSRGTRMAEQQQSVEEFKGRPRLPRFALPRRYDLTIALDLVRSNFSGAVEITIDVVSSTRFLVLNAADLSVDHQSVWFRGQGSDRQVALALASQFASVKGRSLLSLSLLIGSSRRRKPSAPRRSLKSTRTRFWFLGLMIFCPSERAFSGSGSRVR